MAPTPAHLEMFDVRRGGGSSLIPLGSTGGLKTPWVVEGSIDPSNKSEALKTVCQQVHLFAFTMNQAHKLKCLNTKNAFLSTIFRWNRGIVN